MVTVASPLWGWVPPVLVAVTEPPLGLAIREERAGCRCGSVGRVLAWHIQSLESDLHKARPMLGKPALRETKQHAQGQPGL